MKAYVPFLLSWSHIYFSGAMHFGIFGLWGTYVFAVLILYSPDGKTSTGNLNGK